MTPKGQGVILIVDDTPAIRLLLKQLLAGQGYELAFAIDGGQALRMAAELTPDLILLDIMMPVLDGFEVCRRLRADALLGDVPILMITSLNDRDSRLRGIEAGADDFIAKPLDRVELQARVQGIMRLNRYRRLLMEREQRQHVEEEVQRRTRELELLKETEQLKDRFISNMSHELRTPLSIVTLLAGNLDALYTELDDSQRRSMISDIRAQTRTLNELVNNVLEIARIDGKHVSSEREPVNLAHLVREETEKQRPLAKKKRHTLEVIGAEDLYVSGDARQLRQIVRNLLNNATKYTPEGGRIVWECSAHEAAEQPMVAPGAEQEWPGRANLPPGRWAALRLIDTGGGIADEDLPHIFERFYRAKSQSNISGTGLGLSIAQELAQALDGRIAAASIVGKGSVFAVYLPQLQE